MTNTLISFLTPKKLQLQGLWLGDSQAKTVYIFLHGLGGSLFGCSPILESLSKQKKTAVFTFNNRGFGLINSFRIKKNKNKKEYLLAGMAHEQFSGCLDDIGGAINYVRSRGVTKIFLIGHSTGCQKIVYYLSKKSPALVKGAILLSPISDYASIDKKDLVYKKALLSANRFKASGHPQKLLPAQLWPYPISAQRFLSLYTAKSIEEIFTYSSNRSPRLLKKVIKPILVILGEADLCADRPVLDIKLWFDGVMAKKKNYHSFIIKEAGHSFDSYEEEVFKIIKNVSS